MLIVGYCYGIRSERRLCEEVEDRLAFRSFCRLERIPIIQLRIRQPLGYAIVGGLLVSQILTLFTTPVIYLYLDRFSNWLGRSSADQSKETNFCGEGHQT
jgi:hypothetical protein